MMRMMKTGYRWKVYYETTLLHEDSDSYETEDEAYEEAVAYVESKKADYDVDGADYDENEFCIIVITPDENEICY